MVEREREPELGGSWHRHLTRHPTSPTVPFPESVGVFLRVGLVAVLRPLPVGSRVASDVS